MPDPRLPAGGATATAELPRREPGAIPPPTQPVYATADPELLERVLRGLRQME
nr:hypothetical protein GCM10020241_05450 [Streptoalloteichus tenebrarius]